MANKTKSVATTETIDSITGVQDASKNVASKELPNGCKTSVSTEVKSENMPKPVVNTSKVAELVGAGATPSVGVSTTTLRAGQRINYSGSADSIGADHSAMPNGAGINKSGNRPGRTLDTAVSHVDDVPAETYTVPVKSIPMIHEGMSYVAYNGAYRNEHAISQKGSGGSPADSDFFRTLDECQYDIGYFGSGQINMIQGDAEQDLTLDSWVRADKVWTTTPVRRGNWAVDTVSFTFDANRNLIDVEFETQDESQPALNSEPIIRVAGDNAIRSMNQYELDRVRMIDTAGDETKSNWSFLGKTLPNARSTNAIIGEMDKIIGDYMFLSASKLKHALSYQLNKAAKDGQRKLGPILEMCNGNIITNNVYREQYYGDDDQVHIRDLFAHQDYRNPDMACGSALMYIHMMDSTPKYNTKGKFLALPLSFKTAVSTFNQNSGEFRMHQTLYDEFNRQEVFGKVDEDASGISPYFISDGAKLFEPINIFTGAMANYSVANPICLLHYEDLRNEYNVPVFNYLIAGIRDYVSRYASKICDQLTAQPNGNFVWSMRVTSTTTCLSMWDILLCAASKDIAIQRRYALDCVIDYEAKNHEYPYYGSIKLKDCVIGGTTNVGFTDTNEPLKSRIIPLTTAARIMLPEVFWPTNYARDDALDGNGGESKHMGTVSEVVLPWYFSQNQFTPVGNASNEQFYWVLNPDEMSSMTFFDRRGGLSFGNLDRVSAMDPEQLKFCMDRMVAAPNLGKQFTTYSGVQPTQVLHPVTYKYSYHEDGIPAILYYAASTQANDINHRLTVHDILKTPRELGLSFILPAGCATPTFKQVGTYVAGQDVEGNNILRRRDVSHYVTDGDAYLVKSGPSFRFRYWTSSYAEDVANELFEQNRDSNYAVNVTAKWYTIDAMPATAITDIGLVVSGNAQGGLASYTEEILPFAFVNGATTYHPETGAYAGAEHAVDGYSEHFYANAGLYSAVKYLYTRMNILPFIINPFDVNTYQFVGTENTDAQRFVGINRQDPFDFLHLFNMCGFRCGEYSGAEYDRNRDRIQLGIGYVEDPYIQRRQ